MAASAGTIYLLNTLHQLPQILPPQHPYAAFLAPWVHPSKSNVTLLSLAASSLIPNSLISKQWNKLNGFMATTLLPAIGNSSGLLASFSTASLSSSSTSTSESSLGDSSISDEEQKFIDAYGMTSSQKSALVSIFLKYMFAEDTTGANDEALLCLRKSPDITWEFCDDYVAYVPQLAQRWEEYSSSNNRDGSASMTTPQLKIQAYFASSDMMVGQGGRKYFESIWNEASCSNVIQFEGMEVKNTSHDSIGDPTNGAMEKVFEEARKAIEGNVQGAVK